jgi:hypothetical protein
MLNCRISVIVNLIGYRLDFIFVIAMNYQSNNSTGSSNTNSKNLGSPELNYHIIVLYFVLCICSCGLIGFIVSHLCCFSVIVPIILEEYSCPHVSETKIILLLHIGKSATEP